MTDHIRWAGTFPAAQQGEPRVQRVVLLVLDGLRADLVGHPRFPHLASLQADSASTLNATTVRPSVTAAAMASLLSGISPSEHGVASDRFALPRNVSRLRPLPREVALAGLQTTGIVRQVPWPLRPLARRVVQELGVADTRFADPDVRSLLRAAMPALRGQENGLIVMHWPDCDAIGHSDGWMSEPYLDAVQRMDDALGAVRSVLHDRHADTLFIALADHGGGGRDPNHHDSLHPLDCTIPILLAGAGVCPQSLTGRHTLLDVPATVLWALGLSLPDQWAGRPMTQAFRMPDLTTDAGSPSHVPLPRAQGALA